MKGVIFYILITLLKTKKQIWWKLYSDKNKFLNNNVHCFSMQYLKVKYIFFTANTFLNTNDNWRTLNNDFFIFKTIVTAFCAVFDWVKYYLLFCNVT